MLTCDRCNTERADHHITGQRDGQMLCYVCVNELNAQRRDLIRQQRAQAPRCTVDGCNRRGTWRVGHGGALMCGTHKNKVINGAANLGIVGSMLAGEADNETLRTMAKR